MRLRVSPLLTVSVLTAVLWVVPSLGTQGMGTLGQRFDHADRSFVEAVAAPADVRPALDRIDASVEAALRP